MSILGVIGVGWLVLCVVLLNIRVSRIERRLNGKDAAKAALGATATYHDISGKPYCWSGIVVCTERGHSAACRAARRVFGLGEG